MSATVRSSSFRGVFMIFTFRTNVNIKQHSTRKKLCISFGIVSLDSEEAQYFISLSNMGFHRCKFCFVFLTLFSVCYNEPTDPQSDDPDSPYFSSRLIPRPSRNRNRASLDFFGNLLNNNHSTAPRSRSASRTSQPQDDYPSYPGGPSDYGPPIAPVFGLGFGPSQAGWGRKNERVVYLAIPLTALSALLASGQLSNLGLGTTYPAISPLPPPLPPVQISGGYGGGGNSYVGGSSYGGSSSYGGTSGGYVSGLTSGSNYGPSHFVPYGSNGGGGPSLNNVLFGGGGSYGAGGGNDGGGSYGSSGGYGGGGSSYGSGGDSYSNNYDGDSYNGGGGSSSYGGGSSSYSGSGYSGGSSYSGWGGGGGGSGKYNSGGSGNYDGSINVNIPLPPPLLPLGIIGGGGSGLPCLRGPGYYRHPIDCNRFYRCVDYQGPPIGNRFKIYEYNCPVGTVYSTQVWVCVWPYQAEAGSCYVGDTGLVPNLPVPFPPLVPPPILPIIGGGISGGYGGTYDDEKPSLRGKSMDNDDDAVPARSVSDTVAPVTTTASNLSSLMQPVSGKPRCLSVGFFVHPFDCTQFAQCWKSSTEDDITGNYFKCPPKTVFNAKVPVCDDPANVPDISSSCLQRLNRR